MRGLSIETRREIEKKTDDLVERAKELIKFSWKKKKDEKEIETTIYKQEKVGRAQIRNLLDMAMQTDSIRALILFVEYQIGRRQIPKEWGDKLIEDINEIEAMAEEISKEEKKETMQEVARLFLGYLFRYFTYMKEFGG